tara:strand:- start:363 stop:932 length:570 start_codon:yes stop_codon:yes gene_type:complete
MKNHRHIIVLIPLWILCLAFTSSCGSSQKVGKREKASKVQQRRIPKIKDGKSENPATLKEPNSEKQRNEELYAFIEKWKGVPHRMGGMSTRGVDCSGLVIQIYKEVYQMDFKNRRARDIYTETIAIAKEDLKEGDLVFFKIRSKNIDHIGLYLSDGKFVHASSSKGVMISNLEENYFKKHFFSGGRIKP